MAQKKRVDVSKSNIGSLMSTYVKSIDLEVKDTVYYVYIGFQNEKYKTITDAKSIFLTKDVEVKALIKDLKTAVLEMETKQNIEWRKELYVLALYDFSNRLYISEKPTKGSGYTTISKKEVEELIKWLESFEFGKG
jgi:hypothetical protein